MAEKHPKRPRDPNQLAKLVVDIATGEIEEESAEPKTTEPVGSKGGKARAVQLSKKRRTEIAKAAATARWSKSKHPQD
jgi:hypothetical protein